MAEPFFGSVSPLWAGVPNPAFGYPSAPTPAGSRPLGQSLIEPFGGMAPGGVSAVTGMNAPGISPLGIPAFGAAEIGVGITAPALLASIAIRRGQPMGPTNDAEIEDFIYDALDVLPGANDVEIRSEGGRITFTGSVPHKRLKRDIGEVAWAIPNVIDVQNNINIAQRRRQRGRENEPSVAAARKQA